MGIREQVIDVLKNNIQASSFDSRDTKIYGREESADQIIPLVRADCQRETSEEIRQLYHYVELVRAHFEGHSWSRQQTRYDSAFIADFTHRLMNICNKVYPLTQSGTFKEGEIDATVER
ncbi:hypothetical protein LCGC14_2566000 [marine sediment metagenome]|uniref:Uncharacterized protein n=1 Tax=marine sediment metagenome TaxID=412755 RepID=A0A0F9AIK4_9ZZZZ